MLVGIFPSLKSDTVLRFQDSERVSPCPFCQHFDISFWAKTDRRDGVLYVDSYWECNSCYLKLPFKSVRKKNFLFEESLLAGIKYWNIRGENECVKK